MPTPLNAEQVIEAVHWLRDQPGERAMRDRTERWHQFFDMSAIEDLPMHVSRGDTRDLPSPFLIELAQDIQAERHGGQTSVTLIAIDRDIPQTTTDRVERWLAMNVANILKRWAVQDEVGWHELVSYAGLITFGYAGADKDIPYEVRTPSPVTSFFSVDGGGPQRPAAFAEEYDALVMDMMRRYAGARGLNGNQDAAPYLKSTSAGYRWDWQEISDDRPRSSLGMGSMFGKMCTHLRYDDGYYCYHVALQPGKQREGIMLWYDENRAGKNRDNGESAAAALVVPGAWTGQREPRNRLVAGFLPGIQYTHIINYITSLMASRVEQATGDVLVEQSPEMVEALANTGRLTATATALNRGNPSIVEVAGKPVMWERLPLQDLRDLMDFFKVERDRWSNSLREISDPQQLSEINTNVYLPHAAARRQKMKPWNDSMDWALAELCRFICNSLQYQNAKPAKMVARGDEYYGSAYRQMDAGESVEVKPEDVKDFDKRYILQVATNNISDAEMRQRMVDHDDKVLRGYATKRQGIGILYPDEQAQIDILAEDEAYLAATQLLMPQVPTTVQRKLRLRGGILLPLAGAVPPPASPAASAGQQPYPQPTIPGAESDSGPPVPQAQPPPSGQMALPAPAGMP